MLIDGMRLPSHQRVRLNTDYLAVVAEVSFVDLSFAHETFSKTIAIERVVR
jgi:hypothetical protein